MQSDVAETDKDYTVKIDMPGMNKEDINVNYKDGFLTVVGSRKSFKDTSDKDKNIIHKERSEGRISRSYRLPNIVASEIHAKYDNGVLTITLPKQNAGDDSNSIHIDVSWKTKPVVHCIHHIITTIHHIVCHIENFLSIFLLV